MNQLSAQHISRCWHGKIGRRSNRFNAEWLHRTAGRLSSGIATAIQHIARSPTLRWERFEFWLFRDARGAAARRRADTHSHEKTAASAAQSMMPKSCGFFGKHHATKQIEDKEIERNAPVLRA